MIEAAIENAPWKDRIGVYIFDRIGMKSAVAHVKDGNLVFTIVEDDLSTVEPTFSTRPDQVAPLMAALAEAARRDLKVELDSDSRVRGRLEAMTEHLKDLRDLVFKGKRGHQARRRIG